MKVMPTEYDAVSQQEWTQKIIWQPKDKQISMSSHNYAVAKKKINGVFGSKVHKQGRRMVTLTLNMALVGSMVECYIKFCNQLL